MRNSSHCFDSISAWRVRLAQMTVLPGCPEANRDTMLARIRQARTDQIDLLVFPELCVPGYLVADAWERDAFLRECESVTETIVAASAGLTVIFGNVAIDRQKRNEDGRVRKYNALFVAQDTRLVAPEASPYPFVIKTLLPNYRQFDESRHFYDLRKLAAERGQSLESLVNPVVINGVRLGCLLCEDAWDPDYGLSPADMLAAKGIACFVNISASPFTLNKNSKRRRVFGAAARRHQRPLLYVNSVGLQNNGKNLFVFDGASCIYDGVGNVTVLGEPFIDDDLTQILPLGGATAFGAPDAVNVNGPAELTGALTFGIAAFLKQLNHPRVTIGISGGIDSALSAALFSRCLEPEHLLLVNMPSTFNSPTTIRLARQLAARLGAGYVEVPIDESVALTRRQIDGLTPRRLTPSISGAGEPTTAERQGTPLDLSDFMLENVQARDRSSRVLAAVSAAFGGVFTCNANKSELTVGYGTLYGDLCGFLAPIADLWKTEVWALAAYLNAEVFGAEVIPEGSIRLTPSAELSAAQNVDAGQGDPLFYPYHDRLFAAWVEWWNRAGPEDAIEWWLQGELAERIGFEGSLDALFASPAAFVADLERWWTLYQGMGVAKRIQAPPILAVKRRAFGFDHRESQLAPPESSRYQQLKARLLNGIDS